MSIGWKMVRQGIAATALVTGVPQAASAANYYYCVIQDSAGNETRYITDVLETDVATIDRTKTGSAFSDAIAAQWNRDYPAQASRRSYCASSTNLGSLRKDHSNLLANNPRARTMPFRNSPVPSRAAPSSSGGSGLVIEDRTPPALSQAELASMTLRVQREEAAKRAKSAGVAMRNDPKVQALIDQIIKNLRDACGGPESTACAQ